MNMPFLPPRIRFAIALAFTLGLTLTPFLAPPTPISAHPKLERVPVLALSMLK